MRRKRQKAKLRRLQMVQLLTAAGGGALPPVGGSSTGSGDAGLYDGVADDSDSEDEEHAAALA